MEGDAGSGQLTPTPPFTADEPVDPVTQSRLLSGRWPVGVIAGLASAALLFTIAGVLAFIGHWHSAAAERDEAVAVAQSMSNNQQLNQELSYRLRVRMVPDGGTFKIDNIEPVSK